MKSVHIRSFSDPHFPAFGLNTESYGLSFRIQSECRKMGTRKSPNIQTLFTQWDKLQKWVYNTDDHTLATTLGPLVHRRNIASLSLFCSY